MLNAGRKTDSLKPLTVREGVALYQLQPFRKAYLGNGASSERASRYNTHVLRNLDAFYRIKLGKRSVGDTPYLVGKYDISALAYVFLYEAVTVKLKVPYGRSTALSLACPEL